MRKSITFLAIILVAGLLQGSDLYGQNTANQQDLMIITDCADVHTWFEEVFQPQATERSKYCHENATRVALIDDQTAILTLEDVQTEHLPEIIGLQEAEGKNQVRALNVYQMEPFTPNVQLNGNTTDLLFLVTSTDYDLWLTNAFLPDSERRAKVCDESKTRYGKLNDKQAYVLLQEVNLDNLWILEDDPKMMELMQSYRVQHEVFLVKKTNLPVKVAQISAQ